MLYFDNSIVSRIFDAETPQPIGEYLREHKAKPWGIPATVAWEYLNFYDSTSRQQRERQKLEQHFQEIAPITIDVAVDAATISTLLSRHDITLDAADLLHAATARANNATFVTADANDFNKQPIRDLLSVDIIFLS